MHLLISLVVAGATTVGAFPVAGYEPDKKTDDEAGRNATAGWERTILLAVGDALVAGFAAKEPGVSHRGLNFLTGSDTGHSLQSRLNGPKHGWSPVRGSRPCDLCKGELSHFCPAMDILRVEEDEWSVQLRDGLTVAVEDASVDALGQMVRTLQARWRHKRFKDPASHPLAAFVFIGLRDLCKASCSDYTLGERYEQKLRLAIDSLQGKFPTVRVYLIALPEPTQLWHWSQRAEGKRRACQMPRQLCPCLGANTTARIAMLQAWHDVNQRIERVGASASNVTVLHALREWDVLGEDVEEDVGQWLADDCWHWSARGHDVAADRLYRELTHQ